MANGELTSADQILVLGGANVAAVENADGEWEVIQFTTATLVSPGVYDLSGLLRGQSGTEAAMRDPVAAGARFVLLDAAVRQVDMTQADVGLAFNWKYGPAPYDIGNAVLPEPRRPPSTASACGRSHRSTSPASKWSAGC